MKNDDRKEGILAFVKQDVRKEWSILWELESGEIADGKTWKAVVSFSRDWKYPQK